MNPHIPRASRKPGGWRYPSWQFILSFTAFFLVSLFIVRRIQFGAGADLAAFGSYPDEPSHFLSGLMIRDYLLHGVPGSPLAFAFQFYLHMPFFAVGYWPPFFYVMEAAWMLVFGVGWGQSLWLSATVTSLLAATVFVEARSVFRELPPAAANALAACAGLLLLFWPPFQWSSCALMTDTTVALLSLWAAVALGRYLETERFGMAVLFGVCAGLSILTKYSGLYLALIPLPALMLLRRWQLLRRWSFWIQPAIVVAMWAPWLLLTLRYAGHGLIPGDGNFIGRLGGYVRVLAVQTGPPTGLLLLTGWAGALFVWRKLQGRELVWLLQVPAVLVFMSVAPIPIESRYLVPVYAPLILLFCSVAGRAAASARVTRLWVPVAAVVLTAVYVKAAVLQFPHPRRDTMRPIAEFVLNAKGIRNSAILVPADNEGRLIADIASMDSGRDTRILARPNKLFAYADWNSLTYASFCRTPEDVESFFDASPVDLIVLHDPPAANAHLHERLLNRVVEKFPLRWRAVGVFPADAGLYRVYQFAEPARRGVLTKAFVNRMTQRGDLTSMTLPNVP